VARERKPWRLPSVAVPWRALLKVAALVAVVASGSYGAYTYYTRALLPGTVALTSTPAGAEVFVEGERRGATPVTLELRPGSHAVELRRRGASRRLTLHVEPGRQTSEQVDLTAVPLVGSLAVTSDPSGAKVVLDGRGRGITPLTISDVPAGPHKLVLESPAGTIYRTVMITAGTQASVSESIFSGWVAVFAPIELQIYTRKRLLGTTESGRIMVPPGRYELELVNSGLRYRETYTVEVESGKAAAVNIKSAEGFLRIQGPPGVEVLLEGQRVGETPLGEVRAAIGMRELVVRHPQLGERRLTATVSPGRTSDVTIELP
jgi:hypothetical protein